jgi:ribonuclease P protein component
VLPAERRVRRREEFTAAVRDGRRGAASGLVMHVSSTSAGLADSGGPARAGFIVGRAVGSAVTRNRVRRRLRHLIAPRLGQLPSGTVVIVRATPAAATRSGRELALAVEQSLARALRVHRPPASAATR